MFFGDHPFFSLYYGIVVFGTMDSMHFLNSWYNHVVDLGRLLWIWTDEWSVECLAEHQGLMPKKCSPMDLIDCNGQRFQVGCLTHF